MCVCVCVCVRARMRMCMCLCARVPVCVFYPPSLTWQWCGLLERCERSQPNNCKVSIGIRTQNAFAAQASCIIIANRLFRTLSGCASRWRARACPSVRVCVCVCEYASACVHACYLSVVHVSPHRQFSHTRKNTFLLNSTQQWRRMTTVIPQQIL